ncbi:MAG: type II secretion system protein [Lachnospiraceae bacterium]|nr:type II secretion system protein [Lachnospiraceae bacterium]
MKKMNNKGFSLVELIIVIAIMAILIAVLAPQYLRYVEKSRLQSDNSAVGEVANAVKVAAANDEINSAIRAAGGATITVSNGPTTTVTQLQTELNNVCGSNIQLKANKYGTTAPTISVSIDSTSGAAVVDALNYFSDVNQTTATTVRM